MRCGAGDTGYEGGSRVEKFIGAKAVKVPLNKDYAHDVKAMASADSNAGLIYLCNPNNPTGTLTSRENMEWLLANKPQGSMLMVDEAYIHIADGASTMIDLAGKDKDIIVLRTFSKLFGLAGFRAGAAIRRPDLLDRPSSYRPRPLPVPPLLPPTAHLH